MITNLLADFSLDQLLNTSSSADIPPLEVLGAMALSFFLNLLIGVVYKATYRGTQYTQDYVHTTVMIGTITTILIMVVSGNGAVAFGMFAAFSMIRFRRNLGQSRDLAFVFFAMATGMVVGARQYPIAVITTLTVIAAIYIISKFDLFAPKRASHQLRVRANNDIDYTETFDPFSQTTPRPSSSSPSNPCKPA